MKEYGFFSEKKYVITDRNTPRHWYNYLYNDEYVTFVSQVGFGQGFAQDDMGRRIKLVDDRAVYISDGEDFWQANGLPVQDKLDFYNCVHAIGYTDIILSKRGIRSECRFFVLNEGKREYLRVSLKNESEKRRLLKIIPYAQTAIDCRYNPQGYENDWGRFYTEKNCVLGTGESDFDGGEPKRQYGYLMSSETATGFDSRNTAFIGTYGNKLQPKALMENGGCTGSDCIAEKVCFAIENTVSLEPGESRVLYYAIGVEDSLEKIPHITPEKVESGFAEMQEKYKAVLSGVEIKTPWDDLNNLFNDWLKYQTNMGSRWARVRHNGMRDMSSDTECLSCFAPELAADRICRVMTYQYENGYTPRTFIDGRICDNNFADNAVWMVYTVYAITKELGDLTFLSRMVPFNNGSVGTVYEHISRSVSFLHGFTGHHGLVKAWGGDWNDCMNKAGIGGTGVSVWLSIALVRAAKMLSEIAGWLGKDADAEQALEYAREMEDKVNSFGWENDRYIYAISDDYHKIGSRESEEGKLHVLPQIWSVFADFDTERKTAAMDTVERELNTDIGLLVTKPPYTVKQAYLGDMVRKCPGVHENGGVYLHASAWKLAADSIMKRNGKVEEGIHKMLPGHHQYYEKFGEPYVMFNSYMGEQTGYRAGTPGQSWRTASGQWFLYSIVRFIYGMQPELEGLLINPTLPPSWNDCSISKMFRGCCYKVHFVQKDEGACNIIDSMTVNGVSVDPKLPIPARAGEVLNIEVVLKS